jgi:hypothetical protein
MIDLLYHFAAVCLNVFALTAALYLWLQLVEEIVTDELRRQQ